MKFSWRGDWFYKLVAVLLAFGLWLYVHEELNPVGENVLRVPLETKGLAGTLAVAEQPGEVTVRVQGARQLVSRLVPRDIQAFVNLDGAQPGRRECAVQVALPERVELVEVTPARVNFTIETVSKRQLPVEVLVKGRPAPGFTSLQPVINPQDVVVSGPRGWLDHLAKGFVEVDLRGRAGNFNAFLPVRLVDDSAAEVSPGTGINPAMVEVLVPVVPAGPSEEVPVRVVLQGDPAPGYKVSRVVVDPAAIRVYGTREALMQLSVLASEPVDIGGAKQGIQLPLDFTLPEGLYMEPVAPIAVIEIVPDNAARGTLHPGGA